MTDIIILTYGQEDFTIKCFESILDCTQDYRLVWVDNGSSSTSRQMVMPFFLKHANRLCIWSKENLGFVKGVNLALSLTYGIHDIGAQYVVLQNNDTEVTKDWLKDLIIALESSPEVAAAGPITSTPSSWQGILPVSKNQGWGLPNDLDLKNKDLVCEFLKERFK